MWRSIDEMPPMLAGHATRRFLATATQDGERRDIRTVDRHRRVSQATTVAQRPAATRCAVPVRMRQGAVCYPRRSPVWTQHPVPHVPARSEARPACQRTTQPRLGTAGVGRKRRCHDRVLDVRNDATTDHRTQSGALLVVPSAQGRSGSHRHRDQRSGNQPTGC